MWYYLYAINIINLIFTIKLLFRNSFVKIKYQLSNLKSICIESKASNKIRKYQVFKFHCH